MSHQQKSFFDEQKPTTNFTLWTKQSLPLSEVKSKSSYQSIIRKFSFSNNKYKKRFFALCGDKLYYSRTQNSQCTTGYLNIRMANFSYTKDKYKDQDIYKVKFFRNDRYSKFIVTDLVSLENLIKAVRPFVIQTNFHEIYSGMKVIGKGGFASVYLCQNKLTNEKVAVKAFAKKKIGAMANGRKLLINEIEISRSLSHPNIMKFIEVFESSNTVYVILELLEGGELIDHIKDKTNLTIQLISKIIRSLLKALVYLDEQGIIHRDIKPNNIILKSKGKISSSDIKLIDFGLATYTDTSRHIVERCGTPGYIAPEILTYEHARSLKQTPKSDVFSIGVILYYLLVGKLPFRSSTIEGTLLKNFECSVNYSNPRISRVPHVKSLLMKMLQADPLRRISAEEALEHKFFDGYKDSVDSFDLSDVNLEVYEDMSPTAKKLVTNEYNLLLTEDMNRTDKSNCDTAASGSFKIRTGKK